MDITPGERNFIRALAGYYAAVDQDRNNDKHSASVLNTYRGTIAAANALQAEMADDHPNGDALDPSKDIAAPIPELPFDEVDEPVVEKKPKKDSTTNILGVDQ